MDQPKLSIDTVDCIEKKSPEKMYQDQYESTETSSDNEIAKLPLMHTVSFYRRQTQQVCK